MKPPIVIVAFGTTSDAITTYRHIGEKIKNHFMDREIFWSFSSRAITRQLQWQGQENIRHPEELFSLLTERGYRCAIVQSLHLFPGTEFTSLTTIMLAAKLRCIPGSPLINSPDDYAEICRILQPFISTTKGKATLVLGHGTCHPSWTAYYCLETFLRRRFGSGVFVGTVDKYPESGHLAGEIEQAGYKEVSIIPFFLVAGMHYKRDITGDRESSWLNQLKRRGIKATTVDRGLAMLPGFNNLIVRHIDEAIRRNTEL
jgi:sirohydrochlorin cobaltochelatase